MQEITSSKRDFENFLSQGAFLKTFNISGLLFVMFILENF